MSSNTENSRKRIRSRKRKNSFLNKYKLYIILAVIILVILCLILLFINGKSHCESENTDFNIIPDTDIVTFHENMTESDIPLILSDDGITPAAPGCVIDGAEYLYADSNVIANPNDRLCMVNKKYNLASNYAPEDLVTVSIPFSPGRTDDVKQMRPEASAALSELCDAAEQEGFILYGASGYRSYNTQMVLFNKSAERKGSIEEANKLNALPGQSEHQLGLAMDLTLEELNYTLDEAFGNTEEGIWLKDNCHKFGFIIRYPKEKEDITGYSYEPWHCRYVGKEAASYIYENDLTLEEFYNLNY